MSVGITIENVHQQFKVDTTQISSQGGPESPLLIVPVNFSFKPRRQSDSHPYTPFDIIRIDAELYLTSKSIQASVQSKTLYFHLWQPDEQMTTFFFPLTREKIFYIQKHREANVTGSLRLTLQVAHYPDPLKQESNKTQSQSFIRFIDTTSGHDDFVIEQSRWVNNILPGLGYDDITLIELPAISPLLPEPYDNALPHLLDARKYFHAGDYHKTVIQCRLALDRVNNQFPYEKDKMAKDGRFQWMKANLAATHSYANAIVDANFTMSSKANHDTGVIFGRPEAETILHMSTIILAYIGKTIPLI